MLEDTTSDAETESETDPTDENMPPDDQCSPNICRTRSKGSYVFILWNLCLMNSLFSPAAAGNSNESEKNETETKNDVMRNVITMHVLPPLICC